MLQEQQVSTRLRCDIEDLTHQLARYQTAYGELLDQEAQREETYTYNFNALNADLDDALRMKAEQYSTMSRKSEYLERVRTALP